MIQDENIFILSCQNKVYVFDGRNEIWRENEMELGYWNVHDMCLIRSGEFVIGSNDGRLIKYSYDL